MVYSWLKFNFLEIQRFTWDLFKNTIYAERFGCGLHCYSEECWFDSRAANTRWCPPQRCKEDDFFLSRWWKVMWKEKVWYSEEYHWRHFTQAKVKSWSLLSGLKSSFWIKVTNTFYLDINVPEYWESVEARNSSCSRSSVGFPQSSEDLWCNVICWWWSTGFH